MHKEANRKKIIWEKKKKRTANGLLLDSPFTIPNGWVSANCQCVEFVIILGSCSVSSFMELPEKTIRPSLSMIKKAGIPMRLYCSVNVLVCSGRLRNCAHGSFSSFRAFCQSASC